MTFVQSFDLTVTQADVLYVAQQIKRDLMALKSCYPGLLSADRILELHDALGTFLINDAVREVGYSVYDPLQSNLVYHELKYSISYSGSGGRVGLGGAQISRVDIPASSQFKPWVNWSARMLGLSPSEQRQVVAGTGWGIPGSHYFHRQHRGSWTDRATYASGPLSAQAQEHRFD
jgi:hypothetical protein